MLRRMTGRVWSYISDIEGNLTYWNNFIRISQVVDRTENGTLTLRENTGFIFGGDTVDKGNGDIRVVKDLLQLKKDYPDRVHLLIGNRDANKLRFSSELAAEDALGIPYWVAEEKRVSLEKFLEKHQLENSRASRLKWMLTETMGSATTFQTRMEELEILGKETTDEAVVDSFLEAVIVGGDNAYMLHYLRNGCLMARVGSTLIVHGGINENNIGSVPGDDVVRGCVDEWSKDLNAFVQQQLDEYEKQPTWEERPSADNLKGKRGGNDLMDYGVPGGNNDKTVVYTSFLDNGNAKHLSEKTVEYLVDSGIRRILVGHVPHGDCPTVINSDKFQVLLVDTSYSDMSKPDNRGDALSEILFNEDDQVLKVHGLLKDKREIEYTLALPGSDSIVESADPLVGKQLTDGSWVKAKLKSSDDENQYMVCKGEGFKLSVDWMTAENITAKLQ